MSEICPKCGYDPRSEFPIGCTVRYWAHVAKVIGHTPKRIRIRNSVSYFTVEPSSLVRLADDLIPERESRQEAVDKYRELLANKHPYNIPFLTEPEHGE